MRLSICDLDDTADKKSPADAGEGVSGKECIDTRNGYGDAAPFARSIAEESKDETGPQPDTRHHFRGW